MEKAQRDYGVSYEEICPGTVTEKNINSIFLNNLNINFKPNIMRKLKPLATFNNENMSFSLKDAALRNVRGGGQTADKQLVSTDQGPDKDTDCGEQVTYDNGTVVVFIDKNTIK